MEARTCLECDAPVKGRSDKKFCSDFCRNAYNNRLNSGSNPLIRRVNGILRKNRRILEYHLNRYGSKVKREQLLEQGFRFNFYTSQRAIESKNACYCCYEYGYQLLANNYVGLVKYASYSEEE